jgi:hypothetical protein
MPPSSIAAGAGGWRRFRPFLAALSFLAMASCRLVALARWQGTHCPCAVYLHGLPQTRHGWQPS